MNFLLGFLTLPVLGAPMLVHYLAGAVAQEAQQELLNEGRIRAQIAELQQQYDAGEVTEQEYDQQEESLLDRLETIRQLKARLGGMAESQ